MTNKIFKIVAAGFTLLLYLSTIVASDMAALTCSCSEFFTHAEHHNHSSNHEDCSCCHSDHSQCDITFQKDDCKCEHDHSNTVELYTMPRIGDDDSSIKYVVALHCAIGSSDSETRYDADAKSCSYGVYLQPPSRAVYLDSSSLRAPPALV